METTSEQYHYTMIYLVDSHGSIFSTIIKDESDTIEVKGLKDLSGDTVIFEHQRHLLRSFCKVKGIHYGEESMQFGLSTSVMCDKDRKDVVSVSCHRQKSIQGTPLTQPRHL